MRHAQLITVLLLATMTGFGAAAIAQELRPRAAWRAEGDQIRAKFGSAVATAGDLNGDGYEDVIVGAFVYGNGDEGRAFVYFGSSSGLSPIPDWTADGNQGGAN